MLRELPRPTTTTFLKSAFFYIPISFRERKLSLCVAVLRPTYHCQVALASLRSFYDLSRKEKQQLDDMMPTTCPVAKRTSFVKSLLRHHFGVRTDWELFQCLDDLPFVKGIPVTFLKPVDLGSYAAASPPPTEPMSEELEDHAPPGGLPSPPSVDCSNPDLLQFPGPVSQSAQADGLRCTHVDTPLLSEDQTCLFPELEDHAPGGLPAPQSTPALLQFNPVSQSAQTDGPLRLIDSHVDGPFYARDKPSEDDIHSIL